MGFTIKDFLNLDIIKGAIVKTYSDTIERKPIDTISVTELPVENFVHKNELVLSTCIGCEKDTKVFIDFVKAIYQSGASALVVSTGGYVKKTPQEVIDYANKLGFPIIEIPWEIRFAGIIESVLAELNNIKQDNAKRFENLQKKLLTLFLNGSTLSEAAELIRQELGNQAVIVNSLGTIKGTSKYSDKLLTILEPPLKILSTGKSLSLLDEFDFKEIYTVYKISSKHMTYGYLYLKTLEEDIDNDYVRDNKLYVVRHIVAPISLWFDREQTIFETEMHHQDNFVWDVIQCSEDDFTELYNQGKSIGYDLSLPYICMTGLISNFEKSYQLQRSGFSSYEEWKFNCIKTIKTQILRAGKTANLSVMTTYQQDLLIVFLEYKSGNVKEETNNFLDTVEARINLMYPKLVFSWGIGENIVQDNSFNKAFLDAKISLEICYVEKKLGYRNIYHNTSIYRLLSILSNDNDAQEIIMNIIGSLIEHDSENKLDLINTFKIYVENKGNVSQTARALHLHRQSLLYRLKRIEEITKLSLDNADDIFLLELCVRLWDKRNSLLI